MNVWSEKISPEQIARMPLFSYLGPVKVVAEPQEAHECVQQLQGADVVGFDVETKPSFKVHEKYPPALAQVACAHGVFLFPLFNPELVKTLKPLWESSTPKAGVAYLDDVKKLQEQIAFRPQNFIELAILSRRLGIAHTGLRNLAARIFGVRISKGAQMSDWSRGPLSGSQIRYAATDAWISRALYQALQLALLHPDSSPESLRRFLTSPVSLP